MRFLPFSRATAPLSPQTADAQEHLPVGETDKGPNFGPPAGTQGSPLRKVGLGWLGRILRRPTVTLSLENNRIRVVVFQGRRIVGWASVAQEPVGDGQETQTPEEWVASRLLTLLKEMGVERCRIVTELPLQTPLMRHIHLHKVPRNYLEQVVLSETLETIPFSADEVDLTWQYRKNGTGPEVFVTAVPKAVVDSHVHMLRQAGIRPTAAYPRAVALAHAAGIPDGIVVYFGPSQVAFILVRHGVPQAVYQVELPENDTSLQQQVNTVSRGLELVDGCQQNIDCEDGISPLPVVLAGQLSGNGALAEALHREVLPFATPVVYPATFSPGRYATNLGLALADRARAQDKGVVPKGRAPSVNLLPERHLPLTLPIRLLLVFVALSHFGFIAVMLTAQVEPVAQEAAMLSARLGNLERQHRQHQLLQGRANTVERDTQAVNQMSQGLESHLVELRGEMETLLARLQTLTESGLPSTILLSNLAWRGESFALSGTASTYEDILRYTAILRVSRLFEGARVTQVSVLATGGVVEEGLREARAGNVTFQVEALVAPNPKAKADAAGARDRPREGRQKP